jgi:hypothetical protein
LSLTVPKAPTSNFAAVPDLGMTAGSAPGGGGLTQGTALPNITTTQKQATATPEFYTKYLNQIAEQGADAAQNAQFIGPTENQKSAFDLAKSSAGAYDPALLSATNLATKAGDYDAAASAGRYMNPYTKSVVDALGVEGRRNIERYLAPAATSAAVGSGQFGSKRGAEALGQAINTGLSNLNLEQSRALQTGYTQALTAAEQERQARLAGSQRFSDIAKETQALNLGDINALATIGEQERALKQNQQLFPMQQLTSEAALMRGLTIPTSTASSYTGPIPGAYNASPLSQIAGMGALAKEVPGLIDSIGKGIDKIGKPVTDATGKVITRGFDALVGGSSGKPVAFTMTGAADEIINVASDGTLTVTHKDGRVENFDQEGKPISNDYNYNPTENLDDSNKTDQDSSQDYFNTADVYSDYYNDYYPPPSAGSEYYSPDREQE